jgi:hypothetical protein
MRPKIYIYLLERALSNRGTTTIILYEAVVGAVEVKKYFSLLKRGKGLDPASGSKAKKGD